jgi:hypothetical protein
MSKGPKCIENINNICEGLNLVKIIRQHRYVKINDLDIVLKTMYPHAQYNDPVPVKHGCKYHYRNAISGARDIYATCSASTLNKLLGPIYNFDIANPEYIEPNSLSLEELIPAFAEFATNRKYPVDEDTELISIGRSINYTLAPNDGRIVLSIVKLFRYNDTALHNAMPNSDYNMDEGNFTHRELYWARFTRDPNFAYISNSQEINCNIYLRSTLAVIYDRLLQEREASEQDREINVDAIRVALEAIIPIPAEAIAVAPAEAIANTSAEAITNASAEAITNTSAEAITNASAEAITNASAEAITNASAEAIANASAEAIANASAEAITNTSAEAIIPIPAEAIANASA